MSSSTHHSATFTWPPTKSQRVVVTGTFDDWSGNTHELQRDTETGYFSTQVPIRYGEKVAYKYVVDGQWMTREDEAKEWGESKGVKLGDLG
jgi:1,4-alpha-glucan branching enzyme